MTDEIDAELERKIVRSLDGELDAAEQAELDRELLRNSQARRVMEAHAANDALAAEAIRGLLARNEGAGTVTAQQDFRAAPRAAAGLRTSRARRGALAAAAAILAALGVWTTCRLAFWQKGPAPDVVTVGGYEELPGLANTQPGSHSRPSGPAERLMLFDMPERLPLLEGPHRGERIIDRRFFGIFDEEENKLYLLQLDRVQTKVRAVAADL